MNSQCCPYTWCAYIVSYTSVQQTPAPYIGRTIAGSKLSLTAAQPNKAPQLKVKPKYAWGCYSVAKKSNINFTYSYDNTVANYFLYTYPKCQSLHKRIRENQQQRWCTKNTATLERGNKITTVEYHKINRSFILYRKKFWQNACQSLQKKIHHNHKTYTTIFENINNTVESCTLVQDKGTKIIIQQDYRSY